MTTVNDQAPRHNTAALIRFPAPEHQAAAMRETARIFMTEVPGLTGAALRRYSRAPVIAELAAAVDKLTGGAR